jgi:hypothetical protein
MKYPRQFFAQDIVRFGGPNIRAASAETFATSLRKALRGSRGSFNYQPAKDVLPGLLAGHQPLEAAVRHCRSKGNPLGFDANEQVIRGAEKHYGTRSLTFRPLRATTVEVRPGLGVKLDPLGYYVKDETITVLMLQPRRGLRPGTSGYGMWRSMVREEICADDLYGARVEIASFDEPDGKSRAVRIFDEDNTPSFSKAEIDQFLSEYGSGYEMVVAELPEKAQGSGPGSGRLF